MKRKPLTLQRIIAYNAFDMLLYMAIILWACGMEQSCVKSWNLILFVVQLIVNFLLSGLMIHQKKAGYRFLWINIFWLALFFLVFSNLHKMLG